MHQISFLPALFPFSLPNLLAELVDAVRARRVDEGEEVAVPHLAVARIAAVRRVAVQEIVQVFRGNDVEGEAEEGLDEAVLDSVAVIHTRVLLMEGSDQQTLFCAQHPLIRLYLNTQTYGSNHMLSTVNIIDSNSFSIFGCIHPINQSDSSVSIIFFLYFYVYLYYKSINKYFICAYIIFLILFSTILRNFE